MPGVADDEAHRPPVMAAFAAVSALGARPFGYADPMAASPYVYATGIARHRVPMPVNGEG